MKQVSTQLMRFLATLFFSLVVLRGPSLLAYLNTNVGYAWLNHSLVTINEQTQRIALGIFTEIAESQTKQSSDAWRTLGYIHAKQQNEPDATAMWLRANRDIDMLAELHGWAVISKRGGDNREALQWYQRAIWLAPDRADAWYFAAQLLEKEDDPQAAVDYYQKGFETGQFELVGSSDIALRLGSLAYAEQNWPLVDYWLDLALAQADFRQSDRAWEAHYLKAESLRLRDDLAAAASSFQWVVDHNPTHYWAHIRLAQVQWLVEGNPDQAELLLQRAIDIDPVNKWAYRIQGDLYLETNRLKEAIDMYRLVLTLDPEDWLARRYLEEVGYDGH